MERTWHNSKPAKRWPHTKTHRLGKEGIREAAQRPKLTLEELQSSTAETGVSVHKNSISHTLNRVGLYGRVARRKPLLSAKNKACGRFPKCKEEGALV